LRRLYTLLWYLLLPGVMLRLWWRGRLSPEYRRRWKERLGYVPSIQAPATVWVHAVSVGEVQAAVPVVKALRKRHPELAIVLTTMTPTGSERVRQVLAEAVSHAYAPYDLPGAIKRFLRAVRPRLLLLIETELWPNLIHVCHTQGVPVVVGNARMSERSARNYRMLAPFTARMLQEVTVVAAQGRNDAERFIALGAEPMRVQVTGNVKFDIKLPPSLWEQAQVMRRLWGTNRAVWAAASTHEGEEELILHALAAVKQAVPDSLLVLVPRHPERFARVADLCRRRGHAIVLRSNQRPCPADTVIFLGDSMGELPLFYAASDLAFVGGSLVPVGGHNLVEPAACGIPVLFGPHTFNFEEISEMILEAGAGARVNDSEQLAHAVSAYLLDPNLRHRVGETARALADGNRGAVDRLMRLVAGCLEAPDASPAERSP
jgi:3-deoxy-D-manno-octulosonic-acid transferase